MFSYSITDAHLHQKCEMLYVSAVSLVLCLQFEDESVSSNAFVQQYLKEQQELLAEQRREKGMAQ